MREWEGREVLDRSSIFEIEERLTEGEIVGQRKVDGDGGGKERF